MNTKKLSDKYVSITEAASISGCSPQNLRALCGTGKLPAQKVGSSWLIEKKVVAKFAKTPAKVGRKRKGLKITTKSH